jgi:hypothetical protein
VKFLGHKEGIAVMVKRVHEGFVLLDETGRPTERLLSHADLNKAELKVIQPTARGLLFRSFPTVVGHFARIVGPTLI